MKLESFAIKDDIIPARGFDDATTKFVATFYQKFRDDPAKVSPILDIREPGDSPDFWPKASEDLDYSGRQELYMKTRNRLKKVLACIRSHLNSDTSSFASRYQLRCKYLGDGRAALYWKATRQKRPVNK